MRILLGVAAIFGIVTLVWLRPFPRQAKAAEPAAWNLSQSRSPESIGWPDNGNQDYWTGRRDQLSITHPSGRQIAFSNVDFTAQRERGQLTSLRVSQRGLTHAEMLACSRRFCDTWNWPATAARVRQVYPNADSVKTAPSIWLAQSRSVSLRITHDGPGREKPWSVECDFNLRPR